MKLEIILKCSKISLIFLKAIISTYYCAGSYELKRRLKNIESSQPKLFTDTKSLFFIKLGLNLIKQVKLVPAFRPWNQILMHFDKMSTNRHCKHFAQFSEITGWRQVAIVFFQNNFSFALDPPTLSNGQMWKKSAPNHPGKPIHPTPLTGNATMETTHFKKGLPWGGWGSWGDLALWGSWAKSVMDWMGDTH